MKTNQKQNNKSLRAAMCAVKFLLVLMVCFNVTHLSAQNTKVSVSGVVTDKNGEPLIGVAVTVKDSTAGVSTNLDGEYTLNVTKGSVLIYSYIGFETREVAVLNQKAIDVKMTESAQQLEDVVVVGYGVQKKQSVVGAITQVASEDVQQRGVVSNVTDALSGSMPGVQVLTSTGMPGGVSGMSSGSAGDNYTENSSDSGILIRGMTTWNDSSPLVLVDGMERNMNDIDINEIESFSVLKDASATAVYGVRGANGVILITTKRGSKGSAVISIDANISFKSLSGVESVEDSYDALLARNYALVNSLSNGEGSWTTQYYPKSILKNYRDHTDPEKYTDYDMKDYMIKDFALSYKANVGIRGGTDFVKYFTSIGYIHDGDIINAAPQDEYTGNFEYDRFNFRSNLDFAITKTTKFSVNLSGYIGNKNMVPNGNVFMWWGIYQHAPDGPLPIYSDGLYGKDNILGFGDVGKNSYQVLSRSGLSKMNRISTTSDFSLDQDLSFITKGLSAKGRFSYDNFFCTYGRNYQDSTIYDTRKMFNVLTGEWEYEMGDTFEDNGFDPDNRVTEGWEMTTGGESSAMRNMYYTASLNYDRTFGKHAIGALALFSRSNYAQGSGFSDNREDWVGRVTYNYDERYLAEMNAAYNGSDQFGDNYKFDLFPSLAIGWRVTEEEFMKNQNFISNLKIKYSIGMVGNDKVNLATQWPYLTTYELSGMTYGHAPQRFGDKTNYADPYNTYVEGTPGNPDVRWEKAVKQNLGLELGLIKSKLNVELDLFKEHRYDMLLSAGERTVAPYFGATVPVANLGIVDSQGMEFIINYREKIGKVNIWASYNWTVAQNEIIYKEDAPMAEEYQKKAGFAIGQQKSQVINGIVGSWNEVFVTPKSNTSSHRAQTVPGDYWYRDYNADGIITTLDNIPYGYSVNPVNTYGLTLGASYNGFSLTATFYGAYNVTQAFNSYVEFKNDAAVIYPSILEKTWTPEYNFEDPTYRSLATKANRNKDTGNSLLYDGSFLRLKTMQIAYAVPKSIASSLGFSSMKVFVNGNNLFYWSELPVDIEGRDFEVKNYPTTKLINMGVNVSF